MAFVKKREQIGSRENDNWIGLWDGMKELDVIAEQQESRNMLAR